MAEVAEAKRTIILEPQRMHLAEHARQEWVVDAEEGTKVEDIMAPAYWSHMASQMKQFDHVEVRMETGEWTADFIVSTVGRNWANVHLVQQHFLSQDPGLETAMARYEVLWRGPQHKWCVKRLADNAVLQSGMDNKLAASTWLTSYENAQ
jgi:hypothetical protein